MKLSEELYDASEDPFGIFDWQYKDWADKAKVLENKIAELEAENKSLKEQLRIVTSACNSLGGILTEKFNKDE